MNKKVSFDFSEFDSDTMNKVFDLMNFLDNKDELINVFRKDVLGFIDRNHHIYQSPFRQAYNDAFENMVIGLIKDQIIKHFDYTPEEILLLTDKEFINLLTDGVYFNPDNYKESH